MRELLPQIKRLHDLQHDIDKTIERAYEAGRIDGVIQYLEEGLKKSNEKPKQN
jgi:hypothetical protein